MKRLFVLLFLLPSLGSCTIEDDYYRDDREPPARVRVETPNYHTHRHYHEAPPPDSYHDERRAVTVPEAPRHEHRYAAPNTKHGHDSVRKPPARVRVETPNYHTHRHYHEAPRPDSSHNERRAVTVPEAPRHEHRYAAPNIKKHGHDSESHERMDEHNNEADVRIHGHD